MRFTMKSPLRFFGMTSTGIISWFIRHKLWRLQCSKGLFEMQQKRANIGSAAQPVSNRIYHNFFLVLFDRHFQSNDCPIEYSKRIAWCSQK